MGIYRRLRSAFLVGFILFIIHAVTLAQTQETFTVAIGDYISENRPGPGAGRIDTPGQVDVYQFPGAPGDSIYIEPDFYEGNGQSIRWRVVAPSGTVLFDQTLLSQRDQNPGRFDLSESGTYQIFVGEGSAYAGVYQFRIWRVPEPDQFDLPFNTLIEGRHDTPGSSNIYTFDGQAGLLLHVGPGVPGGDVQYSLGVSWRLETPGGATLFDQPMVPFPPNPPRDIDGYPIRSPVAPGFITLPETGTYRLIVSNAVRVGDYFFGVFVTPAPQFFDVNLDDTISINVPGPGAGYLDIAGANDVYRFNGTGGDAIYVGVLDYRTNVDDPTGLTYAPARWQLIAPSGAVVFDHAMPRDLFANDQYILPETGTYQLIAYAVDANPALYTLRLASGQTSGLLQYRNYNLSPGQAVLNIGPGEGLFAAPNDGTGTATIIEPPQFGTLDLRADGSFTYTARLPFPGVDQFTYRYTNQAGTITLEGVATIRAASAVQQDSYIIQAGETLNVPAPGVLANDAGATRAQLDLPPGDGTLDFREDGSFTYTPNPGFSGADFFTYFDPDDPFQTRVNVLITVTSLVVRVPGPQFTPQDTALAVPGVSVETEEPVVEVRLNVQNGQLQISDAAIAAAKALPPDVTGAADPPTDPVRVDGSGTATITVTGPRNQVNAVLDSLVYIPNAGFRGVDEVTVVANAAGVTAQERFTITVGEDGIQVDGDDNELDDVTLDMQPVDLDAVVYGNVPPGAVPNGDVFFRVIVSSGQFVGSSGEIGDPSLLARSITSAAEVFGLTFGGVPVPNFNLEVEVCLLGTGVFYYRDATTSPRISRELPTRMEGRYTCALVPNSGTVILIGGEPGMLAPTPAPATASTQTLDDCMVTLDNILNLREGPSTSSPIIRRMPFNVTLTALERSGDWFYVDYLGTFGWAHGDFVTEDGECGG